MPKNLSRYTKLLVVSDTGMYQKDGETYAFGPVVKELQEMLTLFESITWIGFEREGQIENSSYIKVEDNKIKTILLKNVGGKSLLDKVSILFSYPKMWVKINSEIKQHDFIHCRAPSNPSYIAMLLSKKYPSKQFWFKYAGDWVGEASNFYKFQRNKLKRLSTNSIITVNGEWNSKSKNVLAFENPCLTEEDREIGASFCNQKNIDEKINYCFIGGLNKNKGVDKILEAFKSIDTNKIGTLHIVGSGDLKSVLEQEASRLPINIVFYGSLSKERVQEIYKQSHFIILPSQSEGFPKVIGEAMNYGCVPIVSDVSCIGKYVKNDCNGFLIKPITINNIENKINKSLMISNFEFENYIIHNYNLAEKFTYDYYLKRIQKEIFKTN